MKGDPLRQVQVRKPFRLGGTDQNEIEKRLRDSMRKLERKESKIWAFGV